MKFESANIALEGTCNGDVVGGLLLWAGENLQALLFSTKAQDRPPEPNTGNPIRPPGLTSGRKFKSIQGDNNGIKSYLHTLRYNKN